MPHQRQGLIPNQALRQAPAPLPVAAPIPQQGAPEAPQQEDISNDAVGYAMMARSLPMDQRAKAWPGLIEKLAQTSPELAEQLNPDHPMTDQELDLLLSGKNAAVDADYNLIEVTEEEEEEALGEVAAIRPPKPSKITKAQQATISELDDRARGGEESLAKLDNFERIIDKYPDIVGPGTGFEMGARQIGEYIDQRLGTDISDEDKLAARETLKSLTMDFVMGRIADTKGAISEKEMDAFAKSVVGVDKTAQGNKELIGMLRSAEGRKVEKSAFYSKYKSKFRTVNGADEAWREYMAKYPIQADNNIGNYIQQFKELNKKAGAKAKDAINFRVNKHFK